MARNKGNLPFSGAFEVQAAQPFDARMVVGLKTDLTNEATWQALDGINYAYPGMMSVVSKDTTDNNGIYYLKDLPVTDINNWEKSGTGGGISEAPVDGKQYARQDAAWSEVSAGSSDRLVLSYNIFSLTNDSTSAEIIAAFGGDDKINEFAEKMKSATTEFFIEEKVYTDVMGVLPITHRRFINPVSRYTIEFMRMGQYITMEFSNRTSEWSVNVIEINMEKIYLNFDNVNAITSATSISDAVNLFGGTDEFLSLTSKLRNNPLEVLMYDSAAKTNTIDVIRYLASNSELEMWYIYNDKLTYLKVFNNFNKEVIRIDTPLGGGGIPEAPEDGKTYGRNTANWVEVTGDGVPEAPEDGKIYGRRDATWTEVLPGGGDITSTDDSVNDIITMTEEEFAAAETAGTLLPGQLINIIEDAQLAFDNSLPIGAVIASPASILPGYLLCDGRAINRNDYNALFEIIGTTYGEGDGTTTFNIPDFRGLFLRGLGGSSAELGVVQGDAIREIEGQFSVANANGIWEQSGAFNDLGTTGAAFPAGAPSTSNPYGLTTRFNASNVVPTAEENRPTNQAINYHIKAEGDPMSTDLKSLELEIQKLKETIQPSVIEVSKVIGSKYSEGPTTQGFRITKNSNGLVTMNLSGNGTSMVLNDLILTVGPEARPDKLMIFAAVAKDPTTIIFLNLYPDGGLYLNAPTSTQKAFYANFSYYV